MELECIPPPIRQGAVYIMYVQTIDCMVQTHAVKTLKDFFLKNVSIIILLIIFYINREFNKSIYGNH